MLNHSKQNSKGDSEHDKFNQLKIRGAKSHHCFLGVLFLLCLTIGLFMLYSYLEDNSTEINENPINNVFVNPEEDPLKIQKEAVSALSPTIDLSQGKYEFRAAWLASVNNLDFPKDVNLSTEQLKTNFLKILDVYELYHLNALIMQVRPEGDALYLSEINPPSKYVTGNSTSNLPFDLLEFAVTETHKRGIEFHAWFNPFRVTSKAQELETQEILETLHPKNFARKNPNLVLRFQDKLFLNPGEPKVIDFVQQTIMEVVRNYDIDAVHLDDYFYPYAAQMITDEGEVVPLYFGDSDEDFSTFEKNSRGITDIKAWRRDNTYLFIKNLSHEIHDLKPYVQFGISPFGIWGHQEETNGLGTNTPKTSQETYSHSVFADTRQWVKEDLVDYVIPQIYWSRDNLAAPYEEIASWWNDVVKGTNVNLYVGHGTYKLYESLEESWRTTNPIKEQLAFNKTQAQIKGSAFFRFSYLVPEKPYFMGPSKENLIQHAQDLKTSYKNMAIIPKSENLPTGKVSSPKQVKLSNNTLSFSDGNEFYGEENLSKAFLVYQFPKDNVDCENPKYLFRKIIVEPSKKVYTINSLDTGQYTYGISTLNRLHQESEIILINP